MQKLAKAVELRPDDPEGRLELAQLLELDGRDPGRAREALEHYRIASAVRPSPAATLHPPPVLPWLLAIADTRTAVAGGGGFR